MQPQQADRMKRVMTTIFRDLRSLAIANMEYFQNGRQSYHAKFHVAFCLLYEYLDTGIEPLLDILCPRLHEYDLCPEIPANGYRSLLKVVHKCVIHLLQLCRHITVNRDSIFFRVVHHCRELESYVALLGQLRACLYYACKLMSYCSEGSLFADDHLLRDPTTSRLMKDVELLSQECFYGRCLGFQFCESMQKPLLVVLIALASFSEGYHETTQLMKFASSLVSSGKYMLDPDLRARQVVHVSRTSDISFCKAFWSLLETDLLTHLPMLVCPMPHLDELLILNAENFELSTTNSKTVVINPPCAHTGAASVNCRLISFELREGQEHLLKPHSSKRLLSKSPNLVLHCHGGGFVSQSSKSHQVYLRHWARDLKAPILSVDYSLAPKQPFPRALEECFYAYAWALKNPEKLGWTGEKICIAGDSAGGNLAIALAMRAVLYKIRVPDGIMGAYTSMLISYVPSPSRIMCVMDPLLPIGVLSKCVAAYAGVFTEFSSALSSPNEDSYSSAKEDSSPCFTARSGLTSHSDPEWDMPSFSIEEVNCRSPAEKDGWDQICDAISPETLGSPDSEDILFTQFSDVKLSPGGKPESIRSPLYKYNPVSSTHDSGLSLNDSEISASFETDSLSNEMLSTNTSKGQLPRKSASAPVFETQRPATIRIASPPLVSYDRHFAQSPMDFFQDVPVSKNPFMSPLLASDDLILDLPEICLVTCHFDPLLDDSVAFCKRLRQMGKIADLTVLEDLPHGFLNFVLVSKDAKFGSDMCVLKLKKLFRMS